MNINKKIANVFLQLCCDIHWPTVHSPLGRVAAISYRLLTGIRGGSSHPDLPPLHECPTWLPQLPQAGSPQLGGMRLLNPASQPYPVMTLPVSWCYCFLSLASCSSRSFVLFSPTVCLGSQGFCWPLLAPGPVGWSALGGGGQLHNILPDINISTG